MKVKFNLMKTTEKKHFYMCVSTHNLRKINFNLPKVVFVIIYRRRLQYFLLLPVFLTCVQDSAKHFEVSGE